MLYTVLVPFTICPQNIIDLLDFNGKTLEKYRVGTRSFKISTIQTDSDISLMTCYLKNVSNYIQCQLKVENLELFA